MKFSLTATVLSALILPTVSQADYWLTDFSAAQAQAQKENKPIVLSFTGSDWCSWCILMRRQVLDTPDFYSYARDKFVLMEVDLPRNSSGMPPQQLRNNHELAQRYKVSTFPTVLIITADGTLAGGFTGGRTDLPAVTQPLDLALTNAALLQQATSQQGIKKAQTLHTFYQNLPAAFQRDRHKLRHEIADLDPKNITGIHTEIQDIATIRNISDKTRNMNDDEAIPVLIRALPNITSSRRTDLQQLLAERLNNRIQRRREQADTLEDIEAIRNDNILIIRYCLAPEYQERATQGLNEQFAVPQSLLNRLRYEREKRQKYRKN